MAQQTTRLQARLQARSQARLQARSQARSTYGIVDFLTRIEASRWLLIPLLIVAAGLRFHDLDLQSFWYDELMTWMRTDFSTLGEVFASVQQDVWAPGYPLWAYAWRSVVGSSEWLLRFPAALAGVAGVAAIYTLGRRIADHRTGLIAALLLTVLQTPIYYAQEARPYAALILYTILSTYFWWRINQRIGRDEHPGWGLMAGYVISVLIIVYYNYFGLVMLGTQGLMAGIWHIRTPRRWLPLAGIYAVIFVAFAPWVPETLNDLGRESYYVPPPQSFRVEILTYFHVLMNLQPTWVDLQMVFVTLVLGVEGYRVWAKGERVPWRVWSFLFVWLLLPFTITYVYSALDSKSVLVNRYLLISAPAAYLLLAFALVRTPLPRLVVSVIAVMVAGGMVYNLLYGWDYYNRVTKTQYREAAAYVIEQERATTDDPLIVGYTGFSGTAIHFNYYFERLGAPERVRVDLDAGNVAALDEALATPPERVWLMAAFNPPDPTVIERLTAIYGPPEQVDFFQATVWQYEE